MSNVPELRFPEFSGEWVEKRLGEIAKFFKGKGISKNDIDANGIYKCIRYGELFTIYKETIREIFSKTNQYENMIISEGNETLMPTSDVTPNGLATASALNEKSVIIGGDILIIKSDKLINSFLSYYIKSHKKQIMRLVTGITVYHIYANDMKNFKIILPPTLAEQQKIASFLSAIDVKIDLQEQKIEQLEKYKKALLQKLFPTKDTKVPELRFPKFSGEWVEKRLGEVAKIVMGQSPKSQFYNTNKKGLPLIQGADDFTKIHKYTTQITKICEQNDIIMSVRAPVGTLAKAKGRCCLGRGVCAIKANDFFYYLLDKERNRLQKYAQGSTFDAIGSKDLQSFQILIPPTLAEQQKIASFVSAVDKKVELEKEKLKKNKEYKKGLLQKMFV